MQALLLHLGVLTGTVLLASRFIPGVRVKNVPAAIGAAAVFSLLNWAVGWLLGALLFLPALLTFGLLFFFIPLIVNAVLLWLTDKALKAFQIESLTALFLMSLATTVAQGLVRFATR